MLLVNRLLGSYLGLTLLELMFLLLVVVVVVVMVLLLDGGGESGGWLLCVCFSTKDDLPFFVSPFSSSCSG